MDTEQDALVRTAPVPVARRGPLRLKLLVLSGAQAGQSHALRPGVVRLGTSSACDIVLTDRVVSRRHLQLEVTEERVVATDLGSRNGSFYDGVRFTELEVRPGAALTLGTVVLKVVPEDSRERPLPLSSRKRFGALVGASVKMRELFTVLERVAAGGGDVLVQGETGTGKELCAEALHQEGARAGGPFIIVDIAGIPPALMESELFGHVKGAFTGAHGERAGAFERAQGGTVFLDEVGELPLELQPRLLRVLERRQVKRVGANDYRTVDMRVVAATHVDLEQAVQQGRFRKDLYHRLAVLKVVPPPLRERVEDLPLLIDAMLERLGRPTSALSEQTRALLAQYPWPGNVRELRNVVEQAIHLGEDTEQAIHLGEDTLPPLEAPSGSARLPVATPDSELPFKEAKERLIEVFERDYLQGLITRCDRNISRAAREAGIARVYLRKLLTKHGMMLVDDDDSRD
ncbi:sigma 54-interacting transcriptional regulator [Corallococcus macrosporus]|uniref:Sigma-54 dependent transcription regulator n=1 Tax=Myxococcus fulvus (strain ATCC BAA-855 / HW-1) TaxID=483219 RepID=F8CM10_MYXFH|nr:sigma 54-interacting transcriptional regulator [Corallococcus macrosporus]AEI69046.1 sigma-54 dependent transcription regulator [Corallococcus macrosporus]